MSVFTAYRKAFGYLFAERALAVSLILLGVFIAGLQVMEPVLFGWAIDAMTKNEPSFPLILMWAAAGFAAFLFGLGVSLQADRLAHRRRLAAMAAYLEHVLLLPQSFHSEARSGALMRIMTVGVDSMFLTWLSILREHFTSAVALIVIVPIALWLNWKLALLLIALMVIYVAVTPS